MSYAEHAITLLPPWMRRPKAEAVVVSEAEERDALVDQVVAAVGSHLIQLASEDALALHAGERGIDRYPGESTDAFRQRLLLAFEALVWAGTAKGLLTALTSLGYEARILENDAIPISSLALADGDALADGQYDAGGSSAWSWFAVDVQTGARPVDGAELNRIRRVIARIKAAHTRMMWLILSIEAISMRICLSVQAASEVCAFPHADGRYTADGSVVSGLTCPAP